MSIASLRSRKCGKSVLFFLINRFLSRRAGGGLPVTVEFARVVPDGPGDAGHFVGERDGRLVVANALFEIERPALQSREFFRVQFRSALGAEQSGTRPVNKQCAQVDIAAARNAPQ